MIHPGRLTTTLVLRRHAPVSSLRHVIALCLLLCAGSATTVAAQVAINRMSSAVHYISTKIDANPPNNIGGMYAAYQIQNNTGGDLEDVWVRADTFLGGVVGLGTYDDGLLRLGAISDGGAKMAYFYLTALTATTTPQTHTITVYSARPDLPGAITLGSADFTISEVATSIEASANKVDVIVHGPDPGTLGGIVTMTVEGRTGTVGAGDILAFTAAGELDWPADTYQLFSSNITLLNIQGSNCGTTQLYAVADSLSIRWNQTSCYRAIYQFVALRTTVAPTAVSPIVHVASGTQIKHTDIGGFTGLSPIPPTENLLTLTKAVSATTLENGGTVTYTVTLTNDASNAGCPAADPTCNDLTVQDIVDTLPTTPGAVTYVASSSAYDGTPISEPAISGNVLTWTGTFVVPAEGTAVLTFDAVIPDDDGTYLNTVVAHIGSEQIDLTIDTTDDSPGTAELAVGLLPVELTSFTATADGRAVLLAWSTASETNNAGFEVQRRDNGGAAGDDGTWTALTWVEGHGTTELARSYRHRFDDLAPGRHAFRLKQIDFDGTFEYSPEVEIVVEMAERFTMEPAYPNPFNPEAQFGFAVRQAEHVDVALYDVQGRLVRTLFAGEATAGQWHTVTVDGSSLPSGLYLVRAAGSSFVRTQTLTLVK